MLVNNRPWGVLGVTDSPRAPIIAKAKIGEKGERGEPRRLDYIIFVEPRSGRRIPEYQAIFGGRPQEFAALLVGDTVEDIVDVAWKRYGASGIKCRGDGEVGIDRATGEKRTCAGPYNADDPKRHKCEHARPAMRGGREQPPECKPVLSMRLLVPQVPGLGVVQVDTGGVASSIPVLMAQLRLIEDRTRDANGNPHMAGIAVKVSIRPFRDRVGGTAYAWQVEPLREAEAATLRSHIEGFVRVDSQLNTQALPPLDETPEPDIYGLPEPEPADTDALVLEAEDSMAVDVATQQRALEALLEEVAMLEPKKAAILRKSADMCDKADKTGEWQAYRNWLHVTTIRLRSMRDEAQGELM